MAHHAKAELHHADLLARRIIVLDGMPAPKSMWKTLAFCGYTHPVGGDKKMSCPFHKSFPSGCETDKKILQQNINGEMCAIGYYTKVLNKNGVDSHTKDLVAYILEQEYEHLYDLNDLLEEL